MKVGKYLNYTPGNITILVSSKAEVFPIAAAVGGGVAGLFLLLLALTLVVAAIFVIHQQSSLHKRHLTGGLMTNLVFRNEGLNTAVCLLQSLEDCKYNLMLIG